MKDSARYAKIVEWSEDDQCYVGSAPELIYGGCHGDDERAVFAELCEIVEEVVEQLKRDGIPLPPATVGRLFIKHDSGDFPSQYAIRPFPKRGDAIVTNDLVNKLREGDAY